MGLDDHRPQTQAGRQDPGLWRQGCAEEVRGLRETLRSVGFCSAFGIWQRDGVSVGVGKLKGREGGCF